MIVYFAPTKLGTGDGLTPANAAPFSTLSTRVDAAEPGDVMQLHQATYQYNKAMPLAGKGVTIKGPAVLQGNRTNPWTPGAVDGKQLWTLTDGWSDMSFIDLEFRHFGGGGAIKVMAPSSGLAIIKCHAFNVQRLLEVAVTTRGIQVEGCTAQLYSKGIVRIARDSSDIEIHATGGISDVPDDFPIGFHFLDTVHNANVWGCWSHNNWHTLTPYWNGDGFCAEEGTYNLWYSDNIADGNADAGYDIKASQVVLRNCQGSKNKQNFRLWGEDALLMECSSYDPISYGGSGQVCHVHAADGARVDLVDFQHVGLGLFQADGSGVIRRFVPE